MSNSYGQGADDPTVNVPRSPSQDPFGVPPASPPPAAPPPPPRKTRRWLAARRNVVIDVRVRDFGGPFEAPGIVEAIAQRVADA